MIDQDRSTPAFFNEIEKNEKLSFPSEPIEGMMLVDELRTCEVRDVDDHGLILRPLRVEQ